MTRYIDAYALRDKVIESEKNNPHTDGIVRKTHNHEHEHFLKMIADEPTADVQEVKHGEYILKGAWHIECSVCGHILAHIGEAKNYCPSCGAKMDGGADNG